MRLASLVVALAAATACQKGAGDFPDGNPITLKRPPDPKAPEQTAAGCEGLTTRGTCEVDGAAAYCDLQVEQKVRVQCGALDPPQSCVMDAGRGAICSDKVAPGATGGVCGNGTDLKGQCNGNTAVWCDEESKIAQTWDCGEVKDFTCQVDKCKDKNGATIAGAYCCNAAGNSDPKTECGAVTFEGSCSANKATWCDDFGLHEDDCAAKQMSCVKNQCADGAYCCPSCESLGTVGRCDGNQVSYCVDGEIFQYECRPDQACEKNTCFSGGFECCDKSTAARTLPPARTRAESAARRATEDQEAVR